MSGLPPTASGAPTAAPANEVFNIKFVVDQVNQVLTKTYSLVEFDELSPVQHLQLLSDIFNSLSPAAYVDFNQLGESGSNTGQNFSSQPGSVNMMIAGAGGLPPPTTWEEGINRLQDFLLKTLKYKVPPLIAGTFPQSFSRGEKAILFPIFQWVLSRMPENHERVYLARFLTPLEVPEDLKMSDDGIRDLCNQHDSLKMDFINQHKRVKALKQTNADPAEARKKISAMEQDRDKIQNNITLAMKKLSTVPNKDALLNACKSLRSEQEEQAKLNDKHEEQQQNLFSAQRRSLELSNRLRDVRRDIAEGRVDNILTRIGDEIRACRLQLEQQIPAQLNEKMGQSAALQKLLTEPLDMAGVQNEQQQLDREIAQLKVRAADRQKPTEDGNSIVAMKGQVQRVVTKKNELFSEMNAKLAEQEQLMTQLREAETKLDLVKNSRALKGDDFKKYANQVRTKTAAAKTMKQRLADLRGELGVLQYTERLLKSKHDDMKEEIAKLEQKFGAKGFFDMAENLSKVSEQKNAVEQVKGRTLEELSVVVQGLVGKIQERRQKLAPMVNDMRMLRSQAQVVEQDYEEKKSSFEYQQSMLMQEVSKLETEVNGLTDENRVSESVFHRLHAQLLLLSAHQKRAEDEQQYRSGAKQLDATSKSYTTFYHSATETQEARSKELLKRRRELEETHEGNLAQVEMFTNLRKLLQCKLQGMQQQQLGGGAGGAAGVAAGGGRGNLDADIQNVLGTGAPAGGNRMGVDMLVLGAN